MGSKDAIAGLAALAHDGRLGLFRLLVQAGPGGMAAGKLAETTGAAFTTTSAQLTVLMNAKLITNRRAGRSIIYAANYDAIRSLFAYLLSDCCQGRPEIMTDLMDLATNPEQETTT